MTILPKDDERTGAVVAVPGLKDKEGRQVFLDVRLVEALLGAPTKEGK